MTPLLDVFVPGVLHNPLNGSWGSWHKHSRISRQWREKTTMQLLVARNGRQWLPAEHPLTEPKRITFTAYVGARWDDDAIPAAIKPVRDALVGIVIQADDPGCGHEFVYRQETRREQRGVGISVTPLAFFAQGGYPLGVPGTAQAGRSAQSKGAIASRTEKRVQQSETRGERPS